MKIPLLASLLAAASAQAQQQQPPPCTSFPESKQLDFWVGHWDLSYAGGKSTNRITKILKDCVILEEFTGAPGTPLNGRSVSMFDRVSGKWKQTWVDDSGSYLDFTGGMVDGRMILAREFTNRQGAKVMQRMVFDDIQADSLRWTWQRSDDSGATWKNLWEIAYRRAK